MANGPALVCPQDPLAPSLTETESYIRSANSASTIKAYQSDWKNFRASALSETYLACPAASGTLAAYAADSARAAEASFGRMPADRDRRRQISSLGMPNPAEDKPVRTVMAGICRVKGTAQIGKELLSPELLRRMFEHTSGDLRTVRDSAEGRKQIPASNARLIEPHRHARTGQLPGWEP